MPTLTPNPHFASRVDQRQRERRLVLAGRAHVPRDGKARWWCTRKRRSCTRRTRRLACRDGGPVAPRRVGIALALALRPVLGQVALVVGQVDPSIATLTPMSGCSAWSGVVTRSRHAASRSPYVRSLVVKR